ncbi:hypothetical protein [Leifsonia sp. PS1209]|uniref:hypothetical protein n=1 Tax=Leifsonia sp. PS1209 TaxID=2724914 RepID=UPI001442B6EB|nr:hypothetical protein [Leifsonia sp. PS1209]QIZ98379.1 hypothetical protein HF024_07520 [Leifsonia sp. PS1209]
MSLVLDRPATSEVIARSFAFAPTAQDALPAFRGRCTVVRLATVDNELLGVPRWSTLAEAWAEPDSPSGRQWAANPVVSVAEGDDPHLVLATQAPVVIVGVDNERSAWVRAVVDAVRASCRSVLVVDLGHRLTGHAYADIATFGFDRARGGALLDLLTGAHEHAHEHRAERDGAV